jgi:PIN domain nuclease of toxin-antitoxin system
MIKATTIANPVNEVLVSAASAWGIATKVRLGKLPEARDFESRFLAALEDAGYSLISISAEIALRARMRSNGSR